MRNYEATEQAYKNGYEAGKRDAVKWIPVSERLPEENGRYLCNIRSFAFPGTFYQRILPYDKFGFKEDHYYTDDVTHWMPLPESPKEV